MQRVPRGQNLSLIDLWGINRPTGKPGNRRLSRPTGKPPVENRRNSEAQTKPC